MTNRECRFAVQPFLDGGTRILPPPFIMSTQVLLFLY